MSGDLVTIRLDKCRALLKECNTLEDATNIAALAEAARVYSKRVNAGVAMTNQATAIKVKAERRFGEMMEQLPKARGTILNGKDKFGGIKKIPPKNDVPTLAQLNIDKNIAKRCRELAKIDELIIDAAVQSATQSQAEITPNRLIREVTEDIKKKEIEKKRKEAMDRAPTLDKRILIGDFRVLAKKIGDNSISLILTDPPYDRKFSKILPDLAIFAAAKLAEGGSLLCYIGQTKFPAAFDAFRSTLRYWWIIACLHAGHSTVMREYGINASWKAILWFVKGTRHDKTIMLRDTVSGGQEKQYHPWQQAVGEAEYLIDKLCPIDGIVLDPFLGSGTTAVAAKKLGRRWIGIEINEKTAKIASGRLE